MMSPYKLSAAIVVMALWGSHPAPTVHAAATPACALTRRELHSRRWTTFWRVEARRGDLNIAATRELFRLADHQPACNMRLRRLLWRDSGLVARTRSGYTLSAAGKRFIAALDAGRTLSAAHVLDRALARAQHNPKPHTVISGGRRR
jgi:hypothetical protein